MLLAQTVRQQKFDFLAKHLLAGVAEHPLGLSVDDCDLARLIDDYHRVWRRLQQIAEVRIRPVSG
jgi:hypothetical protein